MVVQQDIEPPLLPILRIHDTDFAVDLLGLQFIQVENPANRISFREVQDNGDHTQLVYDPKIKNAFQGTWSEMMQREDVRIVKLPAAIDLDMQALANVIIRVKGQVEKGIQETVRETMKPAGRRRKGRVSKKRIL